MIDRKEIWNLWQSCVVNTTTTNQADLCANILMRERDRYRMVEMVTGIPLYFIGCLHARESAFSFRHHLANGDPLYDKAGFPIATIHVPKGMGPYNTWEAAAVAALKRLKLDLIEKWDIAECLAQAELWNGLGYRKHGINSPYVWAGTNHYEAGKFVADGQFDPMAVDKQVGVAAILKQLAGRGLDLYEKPPT